MWQQRRVGRDHDDNRTGFFLVNFARDFFADRYAGNRKLRTSPTISLNERTDCIRARETGFILYLDHARRSAGSAFELVAAHARTAADTPLLDHAAMRRLECIPDIFWSNMKAIDIIKPPVPGFGHQRQAPPVTGL